ncbi:MAG: hypothetical protein AB7Q76_04195 [Gammaproteobacteria bacterium]
MIFETPQIALEERYARACEVIASTKAQNARLVSENQRLRQEIKSAPHERGCSALYSEAAPFWMRKRPRNCWKCRALQGGE